MPQSYTLSRLLPILIQQSFGLTSETFKQSLKQKALSTNSLILVVSLPLFVVPMSVQAFLSVKTVGSGAILPLGVVCM